jgi:hypothetical protein
VSRTAQSLADSIANVLVVAGWKENPSQLRHKLMNDFEQRLTTVASLAFALNKVIGQDLTSAEFHVFMMGHGIPFDPRAMEDALEEPPTAGAQSFTGRVLCTTDFGLVRQEKVSSGYVNTMTLLKAKVAQESYFDGADGVVSEP